LLDKVCSLYPEDDLAMRADVKRLHVIDSHTGGEPTRVIVSGGPELPAGSMAEKLKYLSRNHDSIRRAVINEPRGSEIIVGALLCEPVEASCAAGVIFFNNVGYLGMCVHGTIGLAVTLAYLGKIGVGEHRFETPVGVVTARLHESGEVTVGNVASYRSASDVEVNVQGYGKVRGDIAWGGNWFFLLKEPAVAPSLANVDELTDFAWAIREALKKNGIKGTGRNGSNGNEIDHVELFGPSNVAGVNNRTFVLCPGKAYDRSPCGTGTSAKLACLYADGKLKSGEIWRQESIVGSIFEGSVRVEDGQILPSVKGSAFITSEADLILDPNDPFQYGLST
jgi:4-hydroxyproline epimerase